MSKIILFEFGKFPEDIDLKPPPKLPRRTVRNETRVLKENIILCCEMIESFKAAISGYWILAKQKDRIAMG